MTMPIVDENGLIKTISNSLTAEESEHPVWKARNAIALDKGAWLYAPNSGHELGIYSQSKQTPDKAEEFKKAATLYLKDYGAEVTGQLIKRGEAAFSINITKETINGSNL